MEVAPVLDLVARALALGAAGVAAVVAATHWAVRRRAIKPFGGWSRTVRSLSDPLLRPVERQLARRGGNPQDASFWLLGVAIVAGLLLITLTRWLTGAVLALIRLSDASPMVWVRLAVDAAFGVLILALIARVIGMFVGVGRYHRWMAWAYRLTDWLILPIQRVLPTFGSVDLSPLVAYVVLMLARALIGGALR